MNLEKGKIYYLKNIVKKEWVKCSISDFVGKYLGITSTMHLWSFLPICYKAIRSPINFSDAPVGFNIDRFTVLEVPRSDLPLYLWMPYKTKLFSEYMRG